MLRPLSASVLICSAAVLAASGTPASADSQPQSAIGNEYVTAVVVSPRYAETGLVLAAAGDVSGNHAINLFVSHDGGASWGKAAIKGWNDGVPTIAIDGAGHEILYAGSAKNVQRSDDYGDTWTSIGAAGEPSVSSGFAQDGTVAVAYQGSDYVIKGTATSSVPGSAGSMKDFLFGFTPSGAAGPSAFLSGQNASSGLATVEKCNAQLACQGPGVTLSGSNTLSGPALLTVSPDYASDNTVFARTNSGLYKSTDGGTTFIPLAAAPSTNGSAATSYTAFAMASKYSDHGPVRNIYTGVVQGFTDPKNPHTEGGVYASSDGGSTWSRLGAGTPLQTGVVAVAVASDMRLFAGYESATQSGISAGLLCSTDGGSSWRSTCPSVGSYHGVKPAPLSASGHGTTGAAAGAGAGTGVGGSQSNATSSNTGQNTTGSGTDDSTQPTGAHPAVTSRNWVPIAVPGAIAAVLIVAAAVVTARKRRAAKPE